MVVKIILKDYSGAQRQHHTDSMFDSNMYIVYKFIEQHAAVCANLSASVLYAQRLQPLSIDHLKTQVCTNYSTVLLKDNITLARIHALTRSRPIIQIA